MIYNSALTERIAADRADIAGRSFSEYMLYQHNLMFVSSDGDEARRCRGRERLSCVSR